MISTRRSFLTTITGATGMAAAWPWRKGSGDAPPRSAHDNALSTATATCPPASPDFPESDYGLDTWQRLPRVPLVRNQIPELGQNRAAEWFHASLITCRIREGRPFDFFYLGGSEPGEGRTVHPVLLFTVPTHPGPPDLTRDPVYLLAHCLKRNAVRTFRLDRLHL
jgi:hypothetical protein